MDLDIAKVPPAVAFIGRSNSGKTTLVVPVIEELAARGHRVGSIKHHTHKSFEIDVEGKDSWRHRKAGSIHTVIASPDQVAFIQTLDHELEFTDIIARMDDVDVVVVEGYRHAGLPSIELFREANPSDREAFSQLDEFESVAVVTDMEDACKLAAQRELPCFDFGDIGSIVDFIEREIMEYAQ